MKNSLRWLVAGSWILVVGQWILFVAQHPAPRWISLPSVVVAVVATLTLVGAAAAATWRRGEKRRVLTIVGVTLLSLAIHFVGIEHEVADNYYFDEGTYRHHANEINQGNFLRPSYFYPHLLYYLGAFSTWLVSLAHEPVLAASGWLFGVSDWLVFTSLLPRLITATLAGLTALPVLLLAERLAGLWAGAVAGLLIAFSPVYNQGSHVNTSDVPSAFFAALALNAVGRLVQRETRGDYVLAGIYAGLAAGTKYPAGFVALAIVAVYLKWRLADRRFSWNLAWAGLPSLVVFLLTTPGLALDPKNNIFGPKGALFGARQYSQGGWIGVVVDSNSAYYGALIVQSFAWPAIVLGLAGLLLLRGRKRSEALWLLPFPALYLALIISMNMVVERNLYPALPPIAVFLGVGAAALLARLAEQLPRQRQLIAGALALACLGLPGQRVIAQDIAFAGPSTRHLAAQWIHDNLPFGTSILKERYAPNLDGTSFDVQKTRWIGSYSLADLATADFDFLILASDAYGRFLRPELHFKEYHGVVEKNYREIFEQLEKVHEISPSRTRLGPRILIYKAAPEPREVPASQTIDATAPVVRKLRTRPEHAGRIVYRATHRWRTYRAVLPAGSLRISLVGAPSEYALLSVIDLGDREIDFAEMAEDQSFAIRVDRSGKYLLRLYMNKNHSLTYLEIRNRTAEEP